MPIIITAITLTCAHGAAVITISEQGPNVVVVGTGSFYTEGLSFLYTADPMSGQIQADVAHVIVGEAAITRADTYNVDFMTGPFLIGSGTNFYIADLSSGDCFGLFAGFYLTVPTGYVSGDPLASSSTFLGHNLQSLGLSKGSYFWSWGTGVNADSLTLNIVPESSSSLLACMTICCLLHIRRRDA